MRILGIDPGLQTTGFGVIEADGPRLHYVAPSRRPAWPPATCPGG